MLDSLKTKNEYIESKNQENRYLSNYIHQLKEELRQKDQVVSSSTQPIVSSSQIDKVNIL